MSAALSQAAEPHLEAIAAAHPEVHAAAAQAGMDVYAFLRLVLSATPAVLTAIETLFPQTKGAIDLIKDVISKLNPPAPAPAA